jgi:anti-sigma factor RsiW
MMPACEDRAHWLGPLVDGDHDAANTAQTEAHIARCDGCREDVERLQALRVLLRGEGVRHDAPPSLHERIAALPELAPRADRSRAIPRWIGPAFAGALAASLATVLLLQPGQSAIDSEIVSSHVRSLQPGHLVDVQTTNQHVVKPWFNGRIAFAPPVPELADQGFPLAGGRLDAVDGKTAAAIVYHRRLHTVNVFVWPGDAGEERSATQDGFNLREWHQGGLTFAAVSDIPPDDLARFEQLYRARSR